MIWLVRHGQTDFNRDGRLQGRIDSPLTELGLSQAARVGAFFAGRIGDGGAWRLVASPLGRAAHTARIIGAATGLTPELDERIMELSIGSWEGLARDEIEALRPDLAGAPFFMHSPDGEPWDVAAGRVSSFLADHQGETNVIAVSHAGCGKVIRGVQMGLSLEAVRGLDTPQDAVYALTPGAMQRHDCP